MKIKPKLDMKEDKWCPDACPISGDKFFMWLNHPKLGYVPTYGGPYDSYTLAEKDENGEYFVHRYDHDEGAWVDDESLNAYVIDGSEFPIIEGKDLLSALQHLIEVCDSEDGRQWTTSSKKEAIAKARAAIDKALGE